MLQQRFTTWIARPPCCWKPLVHFGPAWVQSQIISIMSFGVKPVGVSQWRVPVSEIYHPRSGQTYLYTNSCQSLCRGLSYRRLICKDFWLTTGQAEQAAMCRESSQAAGNVYLVWYEWESEMLSNNLCNYMIVIDFHFNCSWSQNFRVLFNFKILYF